VAIAKSPLVPITLVRSILLAMPTPERQTTDSSDDRWAIRVTDDASLTLVDRRSGDSMHSGCGAAAETDHVYLINSGLVHRFAASLPTRVLEIGLGTGLACLRTAQASVASNGSTEYVAIEIEPIPASVMRQLRWEQQNVAPEHVERLADCLKKIGESIEATIHLHERFQLTIHRVDALLWLGCSGAYFDAIYFDPYSPQSCPALWSDAMLQKMRNVLKHDGRLVSYCVNRQVRDTLQRVGFACQRVPGPAGGKREVLIATVVNRSETH